MIITSQWELGVWIPKGQVHNSECGDLPIFQVGFKFQAYSEQCSESNDNAFVYVNKANKSTPRQHEDNNPYLIFVLFLHRHKFGQKKVMSKQVIRNKTDFATKQHKF